jgi:hypothetical protein
VEKGRIWERYDAWRQILKNREKRKSEEFGIL